jgi:prepilin-type N-terminal cleavage/methylation domain-containing protein
MRRHGFTLIELLTVVAILAILAAILFPTFTRCGEGRGGACRYHLKQLATAALMYAQDYDDRFPPGGLTCPDPNQPDGSAGCPAGALTREITRGGLTQRVRQGYAETWQGGGLRVLQPYVKDSGSFWCPSQEKVGWDNLDRKSYYAGFEWLVLCHS